jgi:hypothetical protein
LELVRIGNKVISLDKVNEVVREAFELRSKGYSQQEAANILDLDRSFISRLEGIGEVRKGADIAVVGFPVLNRDELRERLESAGVDFILLMTERERNDFVEKQSGKELINNFMDIAARVRKYQYVIVIGSDYRNRIARALLDNQVFAVDIGPSPIKEDVYVDPERVLEIVNMIKG